MTRPVGTRAFRRQLDQHEGEIDVLEGSEGGGGGVQLAFESQDGGESGQPAQLTIGKNLTLSTVEEGVMQLDADDQLTLVAEGTNEWSGVPRLVFGFGLDVEDNTGEGEIIVRQLALLQVDEVGSVGQINLGPGLSLEDEGDGVITISATSPPTTVSDVIEGDYTFELTDQNRFLLINDPGEGPAAEPEEEGELEQITTVVTIPADADVDFPLGSRVSVMFDLDPEEDSDEAGNVNVVPAQDVTLLGRTEAEQEPTPASAVLLSSRPACFVTVIKIAPDLWVVENLRGAQTEE